MADQDKKYGFAAGLSGAFINSKLTPLLIIATILLGLFSLSLTPREEEPQIIVPMIDVMVMYPGASPQEVETLITKPLEQILWEVEDMEYIYSSSFHSFALVTARYVVGTDMEDASVRLTNKINTNIDRMAPGTLMPLIKVRSIDDVPVLGLTLWSEAYDGYQLRQLAGELKRELQSLVDVSTIEIIGGRPRTLRIEPDPQRMAAFNVTPLSILPALQAANATLPAGMFAQGNE
ncbi:efflux RND transporter permease subunit, partial [bacterium]|nr:efflux RND transporter permease subunit [bacterium]